MDPTFEETLVILLTKCDMYPYMDCFDLKKTANLRNYTLLKNVFYKF